ncbi:flagellar basal-body rod modification protein FlgD [Rhizobium sp. RU20A]|uniref:flagellar hook assembly protein FlgD n=1 Tax=Rhizobium sp. RU20A TaxID=1907412 RepID=UPI0009572284|nr:flagellar hook assembly protein FlgD [Rhizobium sp. RU20A]SIQ55312.1 flagellar basal-body rod modification protein FlgD [Rhizobium sp. RU20A]
MAVTPIDTTIPQKVNSATASEKASKAASVNYDSFLKLLIAQMKNQDPTDPMKASEQIAQLATFSQVEQSIKTNTNLEAILQSNALGQADSVIGRKVTSADGQTSGVVEQVEVTSTGITAVLADGSKIAIGQGVKIAAATTGTSQE